MNDLGKVVTTISIWAAVVGVLVLGDVSGSFTWATIVLAAAATVSTGFIWGSSRVSEDSAAKYKRNPRVSRLVEKLDDEDIVQLEDLLAARREDRLTERER